MSKSPKTTEKLYWKEQKQAQQSQEILNRPVFVLDILSRVWTFWTCTEQILNITENSEHVLNRVWTFW
jgi:hypothetical protein